jgi:hypothetical protein
MSRKHNVSETGSVSVFRETSITGHKFALSKGLNRVREFLPSSEDGNKCSSRNVVFQLFRIEGDGKSSETQRF